MSEQFPLLRGNPKNICTRDSLWDRRKPSHQGQECECQTVIRTSTVYFAQSSRLQHLDFA